MDLTFINELDEEQIKIANKIVTQAKRMGVPSSLALSIAFRESSLRPNVKPGAAGEIGIMQVLPETAKMFGVDAKNLSNENTNIITGLKYLKESLNKANGDPMLAALGYNAGIGAITSNDPIPETTLQYLRDLKGFGTFGAVKPATEPPLPEPRSEAPQPEQPSVAQAAPVAPPVVPVTPSATSSADAQQPIAPLSERITSLLKQQPSGALDQVAPPIIQPEEARYAGMAAGMFPAAVDVGRALRGKPLRFAPEASIPDGSASLSSARSAPTAQSPLTSARPAQPQPLPGATAPAGATGGSGTFNWGKAFGLTDIEAARAAEMGRNVAGTGAQNLIDVRAETMPRVQQMMPGAIENPRYGGLITPGPTTMTPRESYVQQGSSQGLRQLPVAKPIPTTPPLPSALEILANKFSDMAEAGMRGARFLGKYVVPPIALGEAGYEGVRAYQEATKPEPDYREAALSGLGAAGALTSLVAPPAGLTMMAIPPVVRGVREHRQLMETDPEYAEKYERAFSEMGQARRFPRSNEVMQ
jgi:hypothetical protein